MADAPPPVTPVTPIAPVVENTTTVSPVTSQPSPETTSPGQQGPTLETKHASETSDALNKLFDEAQPATAPAEAPPSPQTTTEPPKTTPVGADDFQARLDAAKAPMGAHPSVQSSITSLKDLAQSEHKRVEELSTKIKDYEAMAIEFQELKSGTKLPEPVEKELSGLRERFKEQDYQATPEFQKDYVQPVRQNEQEIMGLLKQAGLSEKTEKFIQEHGGIISLSQSSDPAGQSNPDMTMADWVDKVLLAPTPSVFKNRIIGKLTQAQDIIERGRTDLSDFKANSKERYETRMKQMEADFRAGSDAALAELGDLAKPIMISPTASAEERVSAEAHNARLKQAGEKFEALVKSQKDPKTAGMLLAKATQADVIFAMYQEQAITIKNLQDKLSGIKAAGSHSQAGDHSPPMGVQKPDQSQLLKQTTEQAMQDLFKTVPSLQ